MSGMDHLTITRPHFLLLTNANDFAPDFFGEVFDVEAYVGENPWDLWKKRLAVNDEVSLDGVYIEWTPKLSILLNFIAYNFYFKRNFIQFLLLTIFIKQNFYEINFLLNQIYIK